MDYSTRPEAMPMERENAYRPIKRKTVSELVIEMKRLNNQEERIVSRRTFLKDELKAREMDVVREIERQEEILKMIREMK